MMYFNIGFKTVVKNPIKKKSYRNNIPELNGKHCENTGTKLLTKVSIKNLECLGYKWVLKLDKAVEDGPSYEAENLRISLRILRTGKTPVVLIIL